MMTTNDTQAILAAFYGRLQAHKLHADLDNPIQVPSDRFQVQLSEHCVRVIDTTTGKTEYSNSIFTCATVGTAIRNLLVYVVAKAMKEIFIARQTERQPGRLGGDWEDFANTVDALIPANNNSLIHFVSLLKKETEKNIGKYTYGAKIIGTASLSTNQALADIDAACTTLTLQTSTFEYCSLSDEEAQTAANAFVDSLLERRLAAKQQVRAASNKVEQARRNNRQVEDKKPLASKFQALTGKPAEKEPTLAEAQKEFEKASTLFEALDWLAAELELVADTSGKAGQLFYGRVRRIQP